MIKEYKRGNVILHSPLGFPHRHIVLWKTKKNYYMRIENDQGQVLLKTARISRSKYYELSDQPFDALII